MLSTTEIKYIVISETVKNIIIIHEILHELNIISENFMFLLLIDNTSMIMISEDEKVIRNAKHINIHYHHIQNLIEKKIIEIFHILINEMIVNDLTKMLLSNKFEKIVELIRISKIKTDSNNETSNDEFNDSETSNKNKNDENFVMNYYEEASKEADKKADKEISFETEKTE